MVVIQSSINRTRATRRRDERGDSPSTSLRDPTAAPLSVAPPDLAHLLAGLVLVGAGVALRLASVRWLGKRARVSRAKATELMLQVHNDGKAVVSSGTREKAELDVSRLHAHGLWATMRQDE